MNDWKSDLYNLEKLHKWDAAIALIENVIAENPNSVDAYLSQAFLIMNLLVEEDDWNRDNRNLYTKKLSEC